MCVVVVVVPLVVQFCCCLTGCAPCCCCFLLFAQPTTQEAPRSAQLLGRWLPPASAARSSARSLLLPLLASGVQVQGSGSARGRGGRGVVVVAGGAARGVVPWWLLLVVVAVAGRCGRARSSTASCWGGRRRGCTHPSLLFLSLSVLFFNMAGWCS